MMSGERVVDEPALIVRREGDGMEGGRPECTDMISWTLGGGFENVNDKASDQSDRSSHML